MTNLLFYISLVFAGGSGALLRYLLGRVTINLGCAALPFGTLIANVLGCFLIGFLSWVIVDKWHFSPQAQTIVLTGFLGGFTTFSAFSLETVNLLQQGESVKAFLYVGLTVVLCIFVCIAGMALAKQM